jgi:pyruvate/2-oxoglutarate dehydrogenase complex dihydrolipoamide acyltransferase (E2) component
MPNRPNIIAPPAPRKADPGTTLPDSGGPKRKRPGLNRAVLIGFLRTSRLLALFFRRLLGGHEALEAREQLLLGHAVHLGVGIVAVGARGGSGKERYGLNARMLARYLTLVLLLLLLACNKNASPADETPAPASPASESPPKLPEPRAPKPEPTAAPSAELAKSAGGLRWEAPAPLVARAPKSRMRAAEYGVQGDESAELSVFYFGPGQGGAIEDNIKRWLGQITQPDGSDTAKSARRSESEVNGIAVARVEAHGTYSGGMAMPGMPAAEATPNAIMLGAIATGKEGPVFFKLVGPAEAVERARPAFDALTASLQPE